MALTRIGTSAYSTLDATKLVGNLPSISGASLTGLSSGLTEADFFILDSQYNSETSGNKTFTNEFVRATGDSVGRIGTGINLDTSNGKYTFTNTGIYLVLVTVGAQVQTADNEAHFNLMYNGSDVNYIYVGSSGGSSSVNKSETAMAPYIFDVTSSGASGNYIQLKCGGDGVIYHAGGSSYHQCSISFYRLGDT
tara:strand:+ start:250 stop:831 length:582 start_codon:yes stop_codon:yes gene_type:complete